MEESKTIHKEKKKAGLAPAVDGDNPLLAPPPPPCYHPVLPAEPALREVGGVGPPTGDVLAPPE